MTVRKKKGNYLITWEIRMVASSTVTQKLYTGWPLLLIITKSPSVSRLQLTFMKLSNESATKISIAQLARYLHMQNHNDTITLEILIKRSAFPQMSKQAKSLLHHG